MQNEINSFISYAEMHPLLCKERENHLICVHRLCVHLLQHLRYEFPCWHLRYCGFPWMHLHCYEFLWMELRCYE